MRPFFCVYGHLAGLSARRLAECQEFLRGYDCAVSGAALDFTHEGAFVDVERVLDALPRIAPEAHGVIDIINHQDWEMLRCTLSGGVLTRKQIRLNEALDTGYAMDFRDR